MFRNLVPVLALVLSVSAPAFAAASPVTRVDDGQWKSNYNAPSGVRYGWFWDANVWVDVAVQNLAYQKEVGIVWTTDGWQTSHVSAAVYESSLADGRERWGIDVTPAAKMSSCFWCMPEAVTFEYAIFYEVNGTTHWDSNGWMNYAIELETTY